MSGDLLDLGDPVAERRPAGCQPNPLVGPGPPDEAVAIDALERHRGAVSITQPNAPEEPAGEPFVAGLDPDVVVERADEGIGPRARYEHRPLGLGAFQGGGGFAVVGRHPCLDEVAEDRREGRLVAGIGAHHVTDAHLAR